MRQQKKWPQLRLWKWRHDIDGNGDSNNYNDDDNDNDGEATLTAVVVVTGLTMKKDSHGSDSKAFCSHRPRPPLSSSLVWAGW